MIIGINGIDGAGKTSFISALDGYNYESPLRISPPIKHFAMLGIKRRQTLYAIGKTKEFSDFITSEMEARNQYISNAYNSSELVFLDRGNLTLYSYIFAKARLLDDISFEKSWLNYHKQIIALLEDIHIVINTPIEICYKRSLQKGENWAPSFYALASYASDALLYFQEKQECSKKIYSIDGCRDVPLLIKSAFKIISSHKEF